ncbi:Cell division protein FtsQ [Lactococcus cremoris]|nr:Cell division protein FtsQ [Lactococcus cremoris]
MSEKDNNLTPWQQKHLEYQKRKAEEAKKEKKANQPKKARLSSPFLKSLPKTEKKLWVSRKMLTEDFIISKDHTKAEVSSV